MVRGVHGAVNEGLARAGTGLAHRLVLAGVSGRHEPGHRVGRRGAEGACQLVPCGHAAGVLVDAQVGDAGGAAGLANGPGRVRGVELDGVPATGRVETAVGAREQGSDGPHAAVFGNVHAARLARCGPRAGGVCAGQEAVQLPSADEQREERLARPVAHAVHAHALDARRGREGPARHQERKAPGVAARLRRLAGLVVRRHEGQAGGTGHGDVDARQALVEVELEGGDHAEGGRKVLEPLGERQARRPLAVLLAGGEGPALRRRQGREARQVAEEGLDASLVVRRVRAGALGEVRGQVEGTLQGDEAVITVLGELVHVARHPPAAVAAQAVCGEAWGALPLHEAASCEKCRQHAVVGRGLPVGDQVAQGSGHVVAPLDQGLDGLHARLCRNLRCGAARAFRRGRRLPGGLRGGLELPAVAQ